MRKGILAATAAFWAVMMALLVHLDVMPKYRVPGNPGYSDVVRHVETPVTREMDVYQGDEHVGTTTTLMTPESDGRYRISNTTSLSVRLGFLQSKVTSVLDVYLDVARELDTMSLIVNVAGKRAEVKGVRVGDTLRLDIDLAGERMHQEMPYRNMMLASSFEPFGMGARIETGQEWRTTFWDPFEGGTSSATVRVEGRETVEISGGGAEPRRVEAYRVVMKWRDVELQAWATGDGVILREETPWGYTLVYREKQSDDTNRMRVEILRRQVRREESGP